MDKISRYKTCGQVRRLLIDCSPVYRSEFCLNRRNYDHTFSVAKYSETLLTAIANESIFWGDVLNGQQGFRNVYSVEPFLPSAFSQSLALTNAFPPSGILWLPTSINFFWEHSALDAVVESSLRQSVEHLTLVAKGEGQDIDSLPVYNNYALFDTPLEKIYGGNLRRLQEMQRRYDPENIMDLAGGWKF